ncbi:Imm26 family immunity protein [Massilia sp. DJPM01]|uniref:Imm26 family immunity protein n=1 Tax=Massilia sp. DJPM01 TaxID=3024404 RepID=UPI00259F8225|nr:Imm26 family immunity protein [Massilia sp. DJPM01]MDM5181659.1 Imm26 family immunity protein [Massilia sp. DJPM01]
MGWWSAPDNPEVTVGDAVLDSVRHFLRDFSREYQENLSRKPTLQELEYALNLAFKVNVDSDILDGFDELEIKQVVLKTAKRPKKHKVTPGDIFAYRLEDGRFGFGRVVSLASVGAFAEIFDYFSDQPIFDYSKLDKWLVPPVPIESYALLETRSIGDWRTIGHTPDFVPGPKFNSLRYRYGSTPNTLMAIDIYGKKAPISAAEAEGLQEYSSYDDFTFNEFIVSHVPPRAKDK